MGLGHLPKQPSASDMRPVLIGDALAFSRALMQVAPEKRGATCQTWLFQVDAADKYRKRFAWLHPTWGNGSLMAHATAHCPDALTSHSLDQAEFCSALAEVLTALQAWRSFKKSCAEQSCSPKSF